MKRTKTALTAAAACLLCAASLRADESPTSNYRIRTNDLLEVRVFQEENLSAQIRVANDGRIRLPLIGTVKVSGQTPDAVAVAVRDMYADGYLVNPQVNVNVLEFSKRRFTVLGHVQRPGAYNLPDNEELTLLQALGLAGGFTRLANAKKVLLKRAVSGKDHVYEVNARDIANRADGADVKILPGDVITVTESLF